MSSEKNKSLFDFIKNPVSSSGSQNSSALPSLTTSISKSLESISFLSAGSAALPGFSSDKAAQFRAEVTKIASSDELLKEVSNDIGTPRPDETEDEFVKRGKAAFRARLEKALSKK